MTAGVGVVFLSSQRRVGEIGVKCYRGDTSSGCTRFGEDLVNPISEVRHGSTTKTCTFCIQSILGKLSPAFGDFVEVAFGFYAAREFLDCSARLRFRRALGLLPRWRRSRRARRRLWWTSWSGWSLCWGLCWGFGWSFCRSEHWHDHQRCSCNDVERSWLGLEILVKEL